MTGREASGAGVGVSREEITADSPYTLPGFFAALEAGRLVAGRCLDCGQSLLPPRPACYACGGREIRLETQPKTGTVYSYTEVRHPAPSFPVDPPFTVGIIELDSGVRLTGRIAEPYEDIEIGTDVELLVREMNEREINYALAHEEEWPIHLFERA